MSNISRTVKSDYFTDTQEATGFLDPSAVGVAYDATARTITLTQAGGVVYYWRGQKTVLTSPWTSIPHDEGNGGFYLSSTNGVNFTWDTSPWDFSDIQVAFASVSGTVKFGLREVHGLMPWQTHLVLHSRVGTFRVSGGTLDGATYTVNTASDVANTPGFTESVIMDEDLPSTVLATPDGTYTTLRIGAGNTPTFDIDAAFPFRVANPAVPDTYLLVNTPTTGAETAGINNRFYNVYDIMVPVTSDADSQKYRRLLLQPQATYTSLASAQAEDPRSLSLGSLTSLTPELVFNARITYTTSSANTNTGKIRIATGGVTYITGSAMRQVSLGGFSSPSAQSVSFSPTDTILSTNVQDAIEEIATGAPTKNIYIEQPSAAEQVNVFFTDSIHTISGVQGVLDGSGDESVTISIKSGSTFGTGLTTHVDSKSVASFNSLAAIDVAVAAIPANRWVWLETSAMSNDPLSLLVIISF